jgi:hypothetical protein
MIEWILSLPFFVWMLRDLNVRVKGAVLVVIENSRRKGTVHRCLKKIGMGFVRLLRKNGLDETPQHPIPIKQYTI